MIDFFMLLIGVLRPRERWGWSYLSMFKAEMDRCLNFKRTKGYRMRTGRSSLFGSACSYWMVDKTQSAAWPMTALIILQSWADCFAEQLHLVCRADPEYGVLHPTPIQLHCTNKAQSFGGASHLLCKHWPQAQCCLPRLQKVSFSSL